MKFLQVTDIPEGLDPEVKEGKLIDIPVGSYIVWVSQRNGISCAVSHVSLLRHMTADRLQLHHQIVRIVSVSTSILDIYGQDEVELQRNLALRGGISLIFPNDKTMYYSKSAKALLCLWKEIDQEIQSRHLTGD